MRVRRGRDRSENYIRGSCLSDTRMWMTRYDFLVYERFASREIRSFSIKSFSAHIPRCPRPTSQGAEFPLSSCLKQDNGNSAPSEKEYEITDFPFCAAAKNSLENDIEQITPARTIHSHPIMISTIRHCIASSQTRPGPTIDV